MCYDLQARRRRKVSQLEKKSIFAAKLSESCSRMRSRDETEEFLVYVGKYEENTLENAAFPFAFQLEGLKFSKLFIV